MGKALVKLFFWLGMFVLLLWGLDQAYPYMPQIWQRWVSAQHLSAYEHLRSVMESLDR